MFALVQTAINETEDHEKSLLTGFYLEIISLASERTLEEVIYLDPASFVY